MSLVIQKVVDMRKLGVDFNEKYKAMGAEMVENITSAETTLKEEIIGGGNDRIAEGAAKAAEFAATQVDLIDKKVTELNAIADGANGIVALVEAHAAAQGDIQTAIRNTHESQMEDLSALEEAIGFDLK